MLNKSCRRTKRRQQIRLRQSKSMRYAGGVAGGGGVGGSEGKVPDDLKSNRHSLKYISLQRVRITFTLSSRPTNLTV